MANQECVNLCYDITVSKTMSLRKARLGITPQRFGNAYDRVTRTDE